MKPLSPNQFNGSAGRSGGSGKVSPALPPVRGLQGILNYSPNRRLDTGSAAGDCPVLAVSSFRSLAPGGHTAAPACVEFAEGGAICDYPPLFAGRGMSLESARSPVPPDENALFMERCPSWLKEHDWKSCGCSKGASGVRIPPSPPLISYCYCLCCSSSPDPVKARQFPAFPQLWNSFSSTETTGRVVSARVCPNVSVGKFSSRRWSRSGINVHGMWGRSLR